jgi:uncharacterized membrane protein
VLAEREAAEVEARVEARPGRAWSTFGLSYGGLVMGTVAFAASMTPSLLPRSWIFQGLVSGVLVGVGYAVGVLATQVVRLRLRREVPAPVQRIAWGVLAVLVPAVVVTFLVLGSRWQLGLHELIGARQPPSFSYAGTVLASTVVFGILLGTARLLRWTARRVAVVLGRWVSPRSASAVSAVLVALLVIGLLDGVVLKAFFDTADNVFRLADEASRDGVRRPTSAVRSGGPGSATPWGSLGSTGRDFVTGGPRVQDLEGFSGRPAKEPIRIYVGLKAGDTVQEQAEIAVAELERTGAFDRAALAVVVTTGTGKVNPDVADALEYLYNGDSALVTVQYSYLPSWISFLTDRVRAQDAARELFNEVYDAWADRPEADRPLLLVYGESLGAHGAEAAFSGLADVRNRTNGVLLVGPPSFSDLWQEFVSRREPGSYARLPVYEGGATVRFAAVPEDLADDPAWGRPRMVYLQQPSDPVVWWSPGLILRQPDWTREPLGPDVMPNVRWYPVVTFWQLSADLSRSTRVPDGHGHRYGTLVVDALVALVPPPGWTADDTTALKALLAD